MLRHVLPKDCLVNPRPCLEWNKFLVKFLSIHLPRITNVVVYDSCVFVLIFQTKSYIFLNLCYELLIMLLNKLKTCKNGCNILKIIIISSTFYLKSYKPFLCNQFFYFKSYNVKLYEIINFLFCVFNFTSRHDTISVCGVSVMSVIYLKPH